MYSDFWWLPDCGDDWMVGVAHQEPLSDTDEPLSVPWNYCTGECAAFRPDPPQIKVALLNEWRVKWQNINVYRTLVVSRPDGERLLGPFVVDVDSDYGRDLHDAIMVTRRVVDYLLRDRQVTPDDIRIFFSGQKGFNVEVRPAALGIPLPLENALVESWRTLDQLIHQLNPSGPDANQITHRRTFIDMVYGWKRSGLKYPYLRLHNSIKSWLRSDGTPPLRMKIEITADELDGPVEDIVKRSESLCGGMRANGRTS